MIKWNKMKSWLLPSVLIFAILGVATIPAAGFYTYSGRSEAPNHVLTYTPNKLTWDSATGINKDGVAEMDLFDGEYSNVKSTNEENLIAPGTGKTNIVRLKNDANESVNYVAVLYYITSNEDLPLNVTLAGNGCTVAEENTVLPEGVSKDQIITTVEGSVGGKQIQDFDVTWDWSFYKDEFHDTVDTILGNQEDLDNVTVGLYIQVEDNNEYIVHAETPSTGDDMHLGSYIALMMISGVVLVLLFVERKRDTKSR